MRLLKQVCSLPTAPFAEQHVIAFIERFVTARKNLALSRDSFGNLLIELRRRSTPHNVKRLVFTAHMDHPGLVARKMLDAKTLEADFRGWVQIDYVKKARVLFFDQRGRPIRGRIVDAVATEDDRLTVPGRCLVRVERAVEKGWPGMFDLGVNLAGGRFSSRVIDDLGGLSAALEMLDRLHRRPPRTPVALLCTRAEEDGFIGAIAASLRPKLLRKTDRIIAIECSAMQPYAPQGGGVIIRVGDRTSIFNSALTYFLTQQAEALKKADRTFTYQRALMPGGTCEATVYDVYGFCAAAVCIALGNYHNMDRAKKRLAAEYIDTADWRSMVKLFVHLAEHAQQFDPANAPLKKRIERRFNKLRGLL